MIASKSTPRSRRNCSSPATREVTCGVCATKRARFARRGRKRATPAMSPLFSIGITTYERRELLKETLGSITRQTFGDFEAIVGNDHTSVPLSRRLLGVEDPRVRIVNHPANLGEVRNMNA